MTETPIHLPTTDARTLLATEPGPVVIDLRSPSEFAEDHVPGAVNVPLFDDTARSLVGTLYKQESPEAAFTEARELTRQRIASLVAGIADTAGWDVPREDLLARYDTATDGGIRAMEARLQVQPAGPLPPRAVVLHCWRGGLRSRSVVAFLRALGMDGGDDAPSAVGLVGGYKGYRRVVTEDLKQPIPSRAWVLRGLTGVGKTRVMRELMAATGANPLIHAVDLEGLAQHRASLLGAVGLAPTSQKAFETGLRSALLAARDAPHVVYEGESRRIGNVILPPTAWQHLDGGTDLLLTADEDHRVTVLKEDYGLLGPEADTRRREIRAILPDLEQRLGKRSWAGRLTSLLDAQDDDELVRTLLQHWYDPRYLHGEKDRPAPVATFSASDPHACAKAVAEFVTQAGVSHVDTSAPTKT